MRSKFIWHGGKWLDVTGWTRPPSKAPAIIRDQMDALMNHATGEMFDSKSQFRAATKAAGCEELGNDAPMTAPQQERDTARFDISEAIAQLEQGYEPPPAADTGDWSGETRMYESAT